MITKRRQRAFPDHYADLEVVPAVDHDQQVGPRNAADDPVRIGVKAWQPEPQHIHRHTECSPLQSSTFSYHGRPPVAPDNKVSLQLVVVVAPAVVHTSDPLAVPQQVGDLSAHDQLVARL